jgi:diacylglycerol diphosphate phosphatase/phosphatidate phosphatase
MEYSRLTKPQPFDDEEDMPASGKFIDFRNFRYHWIDTVLTVTLWIAGGIIQYLGEPFHRFFTERDPTLSYPLISTVWVPTWLLFMLCWIIPAILVAGSQIILWYRFGDLRKKHRVAKFFLAQLVLFQALGLTLFLTSLAKVFFGRQRPNFYAMCDYKGYRNAIATGDFSVYFSLTTPNEPGNIAFCSATTREINESMMSHPSGHASLTFAGMGFLALFLHHMLVSHKPTRRHHLWKALVFTFPMTIAVMVAATRTRDYWHNYDDTIMGGLLGFGCAALAFVINYVVKKQHNHEYLGHLYHENWDVSLEQGRVPTSSQIMV